jgi:hypothetical protein
MGGIDPLVLHQNTRYHQPKRPPWNPGSMELAMAHVLGPKWVLSTRRRQVRIGDLMVAVALTSLGISTVTVVEQTGDKWLMGTFTLAFLVLLVGQRGIARVPLHKFRPAIHTFLAMLSCVVACSMFVALVFLGLIIPQGAALLSVAMLLFVVYLTTWD